MGMKTQKTFAEDGVSPRLVLLNEFAAACLDFAQRRLREDGELRGVVSFAYGMVEGAAGGPGMLQYELSLQDTDETERELEKVRDYARKTGAEAVSVVMDLGVDPATPDLFPGSDGVLVLAAKSASGEVGVMRPYRKSDGRILFGEPKMTNSVPIPLFDGIF